MTDEERDHMKRMLRHAERQRQEQEQRDKRPLTPQELADAIQELKRKHPDWPPQIQRKNK